MYEMFHIIYRTADVKSRKLWTHKWPALNISGFIAQLLRASQLYREVTGTNPVEVLTFSGFYIRHCIIAFMTTRIIRSLLNSFICHVKKLTFEFDIYSHNFFRRGGLLNLFHPYTAFPPNSTLCTCQPAVSLRQSSVTLIRFGLQKFSFSFVFLNLFSLILHWFTLWAKNLSFTWKKKRGGDNSRTPTWSWLSTAINLFLSS